jgi:hypothetical protein
MIPAVPLIVAVILGSSADKANDPPATFAVRFGSFAATLATEPVSELISAVSLGSSADTSAEMTVIVSASSEAFNRGRVTATEPVFAPIPAVPLNCIPPVPCSAVINLAAPPKAIPPVGKNSLQVDTEVAAPENAIPPSGKISYTDSCVDDTCAVPLNNAPPEAVKLYDVMS